MPKTVISENIVYTAFYEKSHVFPKAYENGFYDQQFVNKKSKEC